jgi:hypothetical protein
LWPWEAVGEANANDNKKQLASSFFLVLYLYLYVLDEKIRELLALVQQLTVGSLLCDPTVFHDHNSVHHGEVLHSVGHQQTGLVLQQAGGSDNLDSDNPIIDRLLFGQINENVITDKPIVRKQKVWQSIL